MAGHPRPSLQLPVLAAILFAVIAFHGSALQAQQTAPSASPSPADTQATKEPDAKPPTATEGIPARVVDGEQMQGILGRQVRSSAGEDMGRIVDVLIDKSARVRAAVIDFGGFLGVGNRQIAVVWNAIRPASPDKAGALVVDFTRDQLRVAPAYKPGEQVVLLGEADPPAPATTGATDKDGSLKERLPK